MKVDEIAQRPMGYLNETGVPWLTSGLVWVLLGLSQLVWPILAARESHQNLALGVQFSGVICAVLVLWGAFKLKQRVVFPRGGYVVPRESPRVRILAMIAFSGIFLVWLFTRGGTHSLYAGQQLWAPGFAIVFAAISAASARQGKSSLGYWFAAYLICLGAVLYQTQSGGYASMSWLQVGIGGPLAAYGAIRLRQFIGANPRPIETTK
jgi:hypothetical protein